jgi:hypothetical protein
MSLFTEIRRIMVVVFVYLAYKIAPTKTRQQELIRYELASFLLNNKEKL